MPAIYTDADGRVQRTVYDAADLDTSDADAVVDSLPAEPDNPPWVENTLYYDGSQFYWEKQNPFSGLNFTETEKQALFEAVANNDLVAARDIVETALQK